MPATQNTQRRTAGERNTSAEMAAASVIDLIVMKVRLRARRRAAWLVHLAEAPNTGALNSFDAAGQACLTDRDLPSTESTWFERAQEVQAINDEIRQIEQALGGETGASLRQLAEMFRLSQPELDLLQTCLALAVEPALGPLYGYLQHYAGRGYATETLAARLFGYGRSSLWSPGSPLAVWQLVAAGEAPPGDSPPLTVDQVVIDWLHGELRMDAGLVGLIQLVEPRTGLESWPLTAVARLIQRGIERESGVRVLLVGPPASGRRTFAASIAEKFGIRALSVDTSQIAESDWPRAFMRAQRLAVLGGTALVWHGDGLHRSWPRTVAPAPIQFVACDCDQIVSTCEHVIDHRVELPSPTIDERRRLWQAAIPESDAWPANQFESLVARYRLNVGEITSVARRAPTSAQEASSFSREVTHHRLGELARPLDCPFTWDDLVVPASLRESLEDFAFEAADRAAFWESASVRRLFPRGIGLVALFSGPPGTGKTMAAQVIAADLQLDLFRVDLATVVSKYIGETAKHLARIFARAARMNAVLLFDEADALFAKRTEVKDSHDRYANADTSYLLQLLEEHDGIVILASNKRQNIDAAFIRRMRYVFDFPRPEAAERRTIWRKVISALSGHETLTRLETTIELLAVNIEMSGAQIKNSVLAAMFAGRRNRELLAMTHLLRGVERELSKEGRALGARERERLLRDG